MGVRYRKSIKLGGGAKLNIGKKSAGISFGGKHGGISINSRTGATGHVSAPGTGLSYRTKLGGGKSRRRDAATTNYATGYSSAHGLSASAPEPSAAPLTEKEIKRHKSILANTGPTLAAFFVLFLLPESIVASVLLLLLYLLLVSGSDQACATAVTALRPSDPTISDVKPYQRRWWIILMEIILAAKILVLIIL